MPPADSKRDDAGLPPEFLERLEAIVPAERLQAVLETFHRPAATGFRVNTLLAERANVVKGLQEAGMSLQPVAWMDSAFLVSPREREDLLASDAYKEHRIYVQNLASMIPVLVLDPRPGERVLDLTAAPGSKTLQIAERMRNDGEIAAVELAKGRFFKMRALLQAYGATSVRTFHQNGERVWRYRPEHFDRVLLDAPCSTEGRFHLSDPRTYAYWRPRKIKEMARKQRRLLFSAVKSLRPGGILVYSTCTFAPEENESMVDFVLQKFEGEVELEPMDLALPNMTPPLNDWQGRSFETDVSKARRILPDKTMEGFFVARFRKVSREATAWRA